MENQKRYTIIKTQSRGEVVIESDSGDFVLTRLEKNVEVDKQIKENELKARAWDTLIGMEATTKGKEKFVSEVKEIMRTIRSLEDLPFGLQKKADQGFYDKVKLINEGLKDKGE